MIETIVSVCCCAYNQERYLRRCLESLIMQKTNFKYEILVHDDASTDNSALIIKEYEEKYPDLFVVVYQTENQYSKGKSPSNILFEMAKGKYIAFCEGDDFWVSKSKLQTQVDFLEKHPNFSLCVHAAYYAHEDGTFFTNKLFRPYKTSCEVPIEEILEGWKFATNSIMYRRAARKDVTIPFKGDCLNGDYALTVYLALNGHVYYIDELMSAYRQESIGSLNWTWHNNINRYVDARIKYIGMLERINEYTQFRYTSILQENIDQAIFGLNIMKGDFYAARADTKRYNQLTAKQKIDLWLHGYFPSLYTLYRNIVMRIKNAKYHI